MSFTTRKPGKHPNPLGSHPMGNNPHPAEISLELVDREVSIRRGRIPSRAADEPRKPMLPPGIDLTEVHNHMVSPYGHPLSVQPLNIASNTKTGSATGRYESEPATAPAREPLSEALPERPRNCFVRSYRRFVRCRDESCKVCLDLICCFPVWFAFTFIVIVVVVAAVILSMKSHPPPYTPTDQGNSEDVMPHQRLLQFVR